MTTATSVATRMPLRHPARPLILVVLALALAICAVAGVIIGPVPIALSDIGTALTHYVTTGGEHTAGTDALITAVRLPRALIALLVGAGLAVAGAAMQAVFTNPLAEPGITGVSAGAATMAVLMIVTGVAATTTWALPLGAFIGALIAVTIVQGVGVVSRSTAHLLLVGIALNAFLGACISAAIANAPDAEDARSAMYWLNGDLTGRTMGDVSLAIIPLLIGVAVVLFHARDLNLLGLGDAVASTSGMHVTLTKNIVLAAAALATAAGVAVTGAISFVGLVVPHLLRLAFGGDHRFLLPASALVGGIFLLAADVVARMVFQPVTLQTGTVTALVGAPFLLALVLKTAKKVA